MYECVIKKLRELKDYFVSLKKKKDFLGYSTFRINNTMLKRGLLNRKKREKKMVKQKLVLFNAYSSNDSFRDHRRE